MKNTRKIICILILILLFLLVGTVKSNAGSLDLNKLDFNVQINEDGSMNVTETWDIYISQTNTLYKSFKPDSNKYSKITDVTVKEITSESEKIFTKTNEWAYHVEKDCYYGTKNQDGDFEIGWGVGLDNSRETKKYEISYTVKDVITKYNDYAELYWQFIGKDFEISADKITGTIYLPSNASNKDDIKIWGHTEGLNGTIYATDLNKVEFELNNFRSGRYVEVRTLFPTELITTSEKIKNTEILQTAITEETKWADKANAKRKKQDTINKTMPILIVLVYIIINVILIIIYIKKILKYHKKLKELKKYEPTTKLEYFRDIPDEKSTPGEAAKILNINWNSFTPTSFGKIFSATILDLALKGFIEIKQEKNDKGKEIISLYIRKQVNDGLKSDEVQIMMLLREISKNQESLTLKQLEKFITDHPSKTEKLLKDSYKNINNQLIGEEIIDREIQKEYEKYINNQTGYILAVICSICFTLIAFIIPIILFIINAILCKKIAKKLNVLTQKGVDYQKQWKGLKRYMEDFSMLDRREVPELVIWEKYLVYATAFGIADKVIKQLKIVYPNFDEIATTNLGTYTYMNLMINTDFSKNFSNAMTTSMSSIYSSGSGSGGGFSGGGGFGGGGGRRWRKIIPPKLQNNISCFLKNSIVKYLIYKEGGYVNLLISIS